MLIWLWALFSGRLISFISVGNKLLWLSVLKSKWLLKGLNANALLVKQFKQNLGAVNKNFKRFIIINLVYGFIV